MNVKFEEQYKTIEWKTLSWSIRQKADWRCTRCWDYFGNKKLQHKLHAHHLFYYENEPVYSYEYKDGDIIALCDDCHSWWHNNNKIEYKLTNYEIEKRKIINNKNKEEDEWRDYFKIMFNENEKYYRIDSAKKWNNLSKSEKQIIGKYATKMCNFLEITIKKIPVQQVWKFENAYPMSMLKYINKTLFGS